MSFPKIAAVVVAASAMFLMPATAAFATAKAKPATLIHAKTVSKAKPHVAIKKVTPKVVKKTVTKSTKVVKHVTLKPVKHA